MSWAPQMTAMKSPATLMRRESGHLLTDPGKPQKMATQSLATMMLRKPSTNHAARVFSLS